MPQTNPMNNMMSPNMYQWIDDLTPMEKSYQGKFTYRQTIPIPNPHKILQKWTNAPMFQIFILTDQISWKIFVQGIHKIPCSPRFWSTRHIILCFQFMTGSFILKSRTP
jgi:hypothetical protein